MWSSASPNSNSRLKPLKLVNKMPPQKLRLDLPTTTSSSSPWLSMPSPSWHKEFKLTKVVNRERKKLSTVTTSSSASDSTSHTKLPTTPCDLPVIDNQLVLLAEKLDAVENRITSRQRLFDNLEKGSLQLNDDLQKQLLLNALSQRPQSSDGLSEIVQLASDDDAIPPPMPKSASGASFETSNKPAQSTLESTSAVLTAQANAWAGYLKIW